MIFSVFDFLVLVCFFGVVLGFSFWNSGGRKDSAGYFLGGRNLPWWLIGVSIVAANLSTEQFVGMAGQAAGEVGLAVSAWQLTGSVGIVAVAFWFLPRFLSAGIFTMPEYLEYRYNAGARVLMSVLTVMIYAGVTTPAVLYSGGTALETIFGVPLRMGVGIVAILGVAYVLWGGLLAAVWADLFQGAALLVGGVMTLILGVMACGGPSTFLEANADKLHMILSRDHAELPWTVLLGGMWIPILYYCGLNQFIMQRALGARTLRAGQVGVIFAGALWLLVPFAIVMPGIVAHQLYGASLERFDQAYPTLVRELIPSGARGFIFAALAGAVVSSLASMLNSASTLFTMDLYRRYIRPGAEEKHLVRVGRIATVLFLAMACWVSLTDQLKGGVFSFIQEFQGYISPGIVAAFVFGFVVKKAPPAAGVAALVLSAPIYGFFQWRFGYIAYLHRMVFTLGALLFVMAAITLIRPLPRPKELPKRAGWDLRTEPGVYFFGVTVIAVVVAFFLAFW